MRTGWLVPGALALAGCFSSSDLRAQAPMFSRVYEGSPDAFASCLLSAERSGYFLAPAIARRGDVYLPGELVEIEYGSTDALHLAEHLASSYTARRVTDGALRVEFRRREGLLTQEITPDQAFAPVERCLGPRRADLE